jgi:hypothetical protein
MDHDGMRKPHQLLNLQRLPLSKCEQSSECARGLNVLVTRAHTRRIGLDGATKGCCSAPIRSSFNILLPAECSKYLLVDHLPNKKCIIFVPFDIAPHDLAADGSIDSTVGQCNSRIQRASASLVRITHDPCWDRGHPANRSRQPRDSWH